MSDVVEALGSVANESMRAAVSAGNFSFAISCEKAAIQPLGITVVSLYGIYTLSKIFPPAINYILQNSFNKGSSENSSNGPSNGKPEPSITNFFKLTKVMEIWLMR